MSDGPGGRELRQSSLAGRHAETEHESTPRRQRQVTALPQVLLLASAALLGGCFPGTGPVGLDGREFVSVAVTQAGAERPLVADTRIGLRFADGRLSADAGCNTIGADYEVNDGRLVAGESAMTAMGCDEPRHAQDEWLLGFIGARPEIQLDADRLVLSEGATTIAFLDREVAEPDLGLVGPLWTAQTIVQGDTAASIPAGTSATVQFAPDGTVDLFLGCNEGGGRVEIDGDRIGFSELVTTDMACEGDSGSLEADVLRILSSRELTWHVDANRLELVGPGIGLQLLADAG